MARLVDKNTNQEDMCYYEIRLSTQNIFIILDLIVNTNLHFDLL